MKKYILIFIWMLIPIINFAQGDSIPEIVQDTLSILTSTSSSPSYEMMTIPKIAPVSPNAASLGVFGAIPVGHYTGIPNISIPIYEINLDGKKVPINLSYHASGIKVAQEASVVGLGWSLNAGGCIAREVRGWDDFGSRPYGYYWDMNFPHSDSNNDIDFNYFSNEGYKYQSFLYNDNDSEPDLFHFNFGNFSGTMFFDKVNTSGNGSSTAKAIVRKEKNYLDARLFNFSNYSGAWIITDGHGYKYYFGTHETSQVYTYQSNNYNVSIPRTYLTERVIQPKIITAWYLDSIVSPNKETVKFFYEMENIYSTISVSEDASYMLDFASEHVSGNGYLSPNLSSSYKYYNYCYSKNQQALLSHISFNGGYISFGYSDRLDLESTTINTKAKKLESITIYNDNDETIKNIALMQSYLGYTGSPFYCRLMLDTVKIINGNEDIGYRLSYNKNTLPPKTSVSCDYWGYYNQSNSPYENSFSFKLSPPVYAITDNNKNRYISGLNKKVSDNHLKYGVLNGIQYPTGGKTTFEYETHTFQNSFEQYNKSYISSIYYSKYNTEEDSNLSGEEFTVQEMMDVQLTGSYFTEEGSNSEWVTVYIEKKNTQNIFETFKSYHFTFDEHNISYTTNMEHLSPGIYRIRMANISSQNEEEINIYLQGIVTEIINSGGGLRIKSITDYIDNNRFTKRTYSYYKENKSSGILMSVPQYHSYYVLSQTPYAIFPGNVILYSYAALYINGYSTPSTPFSKSASGGYVGYSYVEEKTVDTENGNGMTTYTFVNQADSTVQISNDIIIKGYPAISNLNNGSPLEVCYFDVNMTLKRKQNFEYVKDKTTAVKGLKVYQLPMVNQNFSVKFYDLFSERWHLNKTIDSIFYENLSTPLVSTAEYGYNDINLLKNYEKTFDSKNNLFEKRIKYPGDFSNSIYTGMKNNHLVNLPVETVDMKNNHVVSAQRVEYQNIYNMYLPSSIYSYASVLPSDTNLYTQYYQKEKELRYYNGKGLINETVDKDHLSTVYLWGYNYQYPIAVIKNATYAQVENILGTTLINNLAQSIVPSEADLNSMKMLVNSSGLLQTAALITYYMYKPLIGIASVTDSQGIKTTYHYDDFNRLKYTKDHNGKIIERYDYHYQGQ
jgi:hypothetical protein